MAKGKGGDDDLLMYCFIFFCIVTPWFLILIGYNNVFSDNTRIQCIEEYSMYLPIYIIDIIHALRNGLIMV